MRVGALAALLLLAHTSSLDWGTVDQISWDFDADLEGLGERDGRRDVRDGLAGGRRAPRLGAAARRALAARRRDRERAAHRLARVRLPVLDREHLVVRMARRRSASGPRAGSRAAPRDDALAGSVDHGHARWAPRPAPVCARQCATCSGAKAHAVDGDAYTLWRPRARASPRTTAARTATPPPVDVARDAWLVVDLGAHAPVSRVTLTRRRPRGSPRSSGASTARRRRATTRATRTRSRASRRPRAGRTRRASCACRSAARPTAVARARGHVHARPRERRAAGPHGPRGRHRVGPLLAPVRRRVGRAHRAARARVRRRRRRARERRLRRARRRHVPHVRRAAVGARGGGSISRLRLYPAVTARVRAARAPARRARPPAAHGDSFAIDWVRVVRAPTIARVGCSIDKFRGTPATARVSGGREAALSRSFPRALSPPHPRTRTLGEPRPTSSAS